MKNTKKYATILLTTATITFATPQAHAHPSETHTITQLDKEKIKEQIAKERQARGNDPITGKETQTDTEIDPKDIKIAEMIPVESTTYEQRNKTIKPAMQQLAQEFKALKNKAPLTNGVAKPAQGAYTSGFGQRWGTMHNGIDIANSIGTPINTVYAGNVIDAGEASGFGLWIRVLHDDGNITTYGHVDTISVSVGQRVTAGEQIGTMGNRGFSTGPHLHFEIWTPSQGTIDPAAWLNSKGISL